MPIDTIAAAMQRVEGALRRKPGAGYHDDAPAVVQWEGDLRVRASHGSGTHIVTDMPMELGGAGAGPTPGWLMRAGLASCATTCIAMAAAAQGIVLDRLEVQAFSSSDLRGLMGLCEPDGSAVFAGPCNVRLKVTISAPGVSALRLRDLVNGVAGRAPVTAALTAAVPVAMDVEVLQA